MPSTKCHHIAHKTQLLSAILYSLTVDAGTRGAALLAVYKLNCFESPHFAVPVTVAPIEPLQTSVQALVPIKLVTVDAPQLNELPP